MNVAWESTESHLLLNPSYSKNEQDRFQVILKAANSWPGHVWLSTSGSSVLKWVGLSKDALLASANAVNKHLESDQNDRWINALPHFHVGGLGIWARAYLSGAKVYDFKHDHPGKWTPKNFYRYLHEFQGTLTALVPTQLHDLVALGCQAPSSLRAVIIGGGVLFPSLYQQAIALGWPLLPSYGMTECASQVATASLESWKEEGWPVSQLLPHVQGEVREGRLCFAGPSLMSTYAYIDDDDDVQFVDPKIKGWFTSEDRGLIQEGKVTVLGRADSIFKVGGENIDLERLGRHLQALHFQLAMTAEVCLVALSDLRLGHRLCLATNSSNQEQIMPLIHQFQETVLPFERIRKIYFLQTFPRSSLGKILRQELLSLINVAEAIDL